MIHSKQEFLQKLKDIYDNDSRLTEQALFNGKQLTDTGRSLMTCFMQSHYNNIYSRSITEFWNKKFGKWYLSYYDGKFDNRNDYETYITKQFNTKVLPKLTKYMEKFVDDTGCYSIGLDQISYWAPSIHITLMCSNCVALELLETDDTDETAESQLNFIFN